MPHVPNEYRIDIENVHGKISGNAVAMSVEQILENMPNEVLQHTITFIRPRPDMPEFGPGEDNEEANVQFQLWAGLRTMVSNLECAAEMSPEWLAENASRQRQAMKMLKGATLRLHTVSA